MRHAVGLLFVVKDEEGVRESEGARCIVMEILANRNAAKPEKSSEMLTRGDRGTIGSEREVEELPRETELSTMHLLGKYPSSQWLLFLQQFHVQHEHTLELLGNGSPMERYTPLYVGMWRELYSAGYYHSRGFPSQGVGELS